MIPPETIRTVAAASDIVDVISEDVPLRRKGTAYTGSCPFHQDKTPSFTVTPARQRFKCFGCGAGGSVFDFVMQREGITFFYAVCLLAVRAGIPIGEDLPAGAPVEMIVTPRRLPERPQQPARPPMPVAMYQGSRKELAAVADLRGLSLEGMGLASACGLLRFGSPRGCPSWIVTDADGMNAQARRMDGGVWAHIGGKKAYTLPGRRAAWPIGTREAIALPCVALVEGGPDLLAAYHFIAVESRESDVAAVVMLGASNAIPEDALLHLANKRVRIFPHLDTAGQDAALRWTRQLERVGCEVDAFSLDGLLRTDGGDVGDLNDLALLDADCFEHEAAELLEVLPR